MMPRYTIRTSQKLTLSLLLAFLFHLLLLASVTLVPAQPLPEETSLSLTVKLGNVSAPSPAILPAILPDVANIPSLPRDTALQAPTNAPAPSTPKSSSGKAHAKKQRALSQHAHRKQTKGQVAKTYARKKIPPSQAAVKGDALGNTHMSDQQRATRYTQQLSLWIEKFKVYPEVARRDGMQGVAHLRLRIDRSGNIQHYYLSHRTPYPTLDKAALNAARLANPVPPIPESYPDKSPFLEFIIPLTFRLNR